jgi:flagellar protein FliO/FliZ
VLSGRPPTDSRSGLPSFPRTSTAALTLAAAPGKHAAAGAAKHVHKFVLHKDTTKLPASLSHPASVGASHVAASSGVLTRTFIGLIVVVALIYGVYWLLKKYNGAKNGKSDGRMDIVATTALAPNRALHLIRVGEELVLVGSAESSITPIRVYSAEESAALRADFEGEPAPLRPVSGFGGGFTGFVTELRARTVRR